jgi:tetratricopeptide (TPR) repeat protein
LPVFSVTTFATFAGLLLAAQKLAADPNPLNRVRALADLATGGKALAAALADAGLTPVAREMARQAEEHARHFTHPGPARDDALAMFWQVAPAAFADPETFASGDLDPDRITECMVAAIRASPHARDFAATALAEPFFRSVTRQTLGVMLARADYLATITPDLWRETLRRHGVEIEVLQAVKDDTAEILAVVRELREIKATTVHEDTLIAIARKFAPHIADRDEALRALAAAADLAAEIQARGEAGSNVDKFVDETLRRLAVLTRQGRLDEAAAAADRACDQAEAGRIQLLDTAVRQHLLVFDAAGAARAIVRRISLSSDQAAQFDELLAEWQTYQDRGDKKGLRLDVEVAIALARHARRIATNALQRVTALNALANSLVTLGEREGSIDRLEEAEAVCADAIAECPHQTVQWATLQNTLGTALARRGDFGRDLTLLARSIDTFSSASEMVTEGDDPDLWGVIQHNLAGALQKVGQVREDVSLLNRSVVALRRLEKMRRRGDRYTWAGTQHGLGTALATLGELQRSPDTIRVAFASYDAALEVRTREQLPVEWAMTTGNYGLAKLHLAEITGDLDTAKGGLAQLLAAEALLRAGRHHGYADNFAFFVPAAETLVARLETGGGVG